MTAAHTRCVRVCAAVLLAESLGLTVEKSKADTAKTKAEIEKIKADIGSEKADMKSGMHTSGTHELGGKVRHNTTQAHTHAYTRALPPHTTCMGLMSRPDARCCCVPACCACVRMRLRIHHHEHPVSSQSLSSKAEEATTQAKHSVAEGTEKVKHGAEEMGMRVKHAAEERGQKASNIGK